MKFLMSGNLRTMGDDVFERAVRRLQQHLQFVDMVPCVPFEEGLSSVPDLNTIPYGSTAFINRCEALGVKGLFTNANFDTRIWKANRDDMLNQDSLEITLSELHEYQNVYSPTTELFIRPTNELKAFNGKVVYFYELLDYEATKIFGNFPVTGDTLISVSRTKEIDCEWRWFIVKGKVVAGSRYRHFGEIRIHNEIFDDTHPVHAMAAKWLPHETCVMDVAHTNEGFKVIEFNCLNAAGLYACDAERIVSALIENYQF